MIKSGQIHLEERRVEVKGQGMDYRVWRRRRLRISFQQYDVGGQFLDIQ